MHAPPPIPNAETQYPAMIMAAGLGKRMRAYNDTLPKPMVPIAGRPLIDYSLMLLRNAGISAAIVNTHYKPEAIETHLAQQTDLQLMVSREHELLETGGGIMQALPQLQEEFFVLNSDVICTDISPPILHQLRATWDNTKMDGLLLIIPLEQAIGYSGKGDFTLAEDGQTLQATNTANETTPKYVYTGVQLLHKRFLAHAPSGAFSLSPLYKAALSQTPCRLHGFIHTGGWYHVGDGEGVKLAEEKLTK